MTSDATQRLTTALADHYAIERELGAGGMATVYLAEDLKHHRKVAIKVLREDLAASLGPTRFLREIEIAAQLQHPHILPLLDSGNADGFLYYVMPFITGHSLRERIAREGELPIAEAVRLIAEVVDALAHAHAAGVVHRDIKPDNVMLSGRHALVADFGVAKAISEATGRNALTTLGVALGTPTYMSPEQAAADPHIDHRSDIYAIGVMAYELLAGRPPFTGATPQQVLAAHVTEAPDPVSKRRPAIPPMLEQVVMKCLAKRPADRWQSAEELLAQLEPLATPSGGTTPMTTRPLAAMAPPRRTRLPAVVGGIVVLAAVVFIATRWRTTSVPTLEQKVQVTLEPGLELDPTLNGDGTQIAYATGPATLMRVFVRQVDGGTPTPVAPDLPGDQRSPRWSPDGTKILIRSAPSGIAVAPALGGPARIVVPGRPGLVDAVWSPDGKEIAYSVGDSLITQNVESGARRLVARPGSLFLLAWSPDGHWIAGSMGNPDFVYGGRSLGNLAPSKLVVVPAAGGSAVDVAGGEAGSSGALNTSPAWLRDGRLLFVSSRDGMRDVYLVALGGNGHPKGDPTRLTTGLNPHTLSVSKDGAKLAYATFLESVNVYSMPVPTGGEASAATARAETRDRQVIEGFDISPDNHWLVFDSDREGRQHIYRMPLGGGTVQRMTNGAWDDFVPAVSPDGREIAFHTFQWGTRNVAILPAEGGAATPVTKDSTQSLQPRWSPTGQELVFVHRVSGVSTTMRVIRRTNGVWADTADAATAEADFQGPEFSPDGRWLLAIDGKSVITAESSGGTSRKLFASPAWTPHWATWAEDGKSVYVSASDSGIPMHLLQLTLTGTPRQLIRFDDPIRQPTRYGMVARNGRIYFTYGEREADIAVYTLAGKH